MRIEAALSAVKACIQREMPRPINSAAVRHPSDARFREKGASFCPESAGCGVDCDVLYGGSGKPFRRRRAALLELGVRPQLAVDMAGSGRGPWYLALTKALNVGLSKAYFRSLGLPSLSEDC